MPIVNPFTDDDRKAIIESIGLLDDLLPVVAKAKTCGVDCQEMYRRIATNRKRLENWLNSFFSEDMTPTDL